jgi:large subunit ribosomal protein L14
MIQMGSRLKVADNSGALIVECIKVIGGSKRRYSSVGDVIVVAVKKARPVGMVKEGEVLKALIVRVKKNISRSNSCTVRFDDNAVILLDEKLEMKGTRAFGYVASEIKKDFLSVANKALGVL